MIDSKYRLVVSGAGLVVNIATDFVARTVGSAVEQKISREMVGLQESITGGLANAVSGAIYGKSPLKSLRSSVGRGAGAGAATAEINYISDAIGSGLSNQREGVGSAITSALTDVPQITPYAKCRDPKTICGVPTFGGGMEYGVSYGYQYNIQGGQKYGDGGSSRPKKKEYSLSGFMKEVLIGGFVGGVFGAGFYGTKVVGSWMNGIQGNEVSKTPVKTDFYVTPSGDVVPATGYRYMSRDARYMSSLRNTMEIPANSNGTYITFDKFDVPEPGKLQVPHDASIRGSFDTLQIVDDIRIPNGKWGTASWLEPITNDYPNLGSGGATQAITNKRIVLDNIIYLNKGECAMIYSNKDDINRCSKIVQERLIERNITVNEKILFEITEEIMNISYSKGGDYSNSIFQCFAKIYFEDELYKKHLEA